MSTVTDNKLESIRRLVLGDLYKQCSTTGITEEQLKNITEELKNNDSLLAKLNKRLSRLGVIVDKTCSFEEIARVCNFNERYVPRSQCVGTITETNGKYIKDQTREAIEKILESEYTQASDEYKQASEELKGVGENDEQSRKIKSEVQGSKLTIMQDKLNANNAYKGSLLFENEPDDEPEPEEEKIPEGYCGENCVACGSKYYNDDNRKKILPIKLPIVKRTETRKDKDGKEYTVEVNQCGHCIHRLCMRKITKKECPACKTRLPVNPKEHILSKYESCKSTLSPELRDDFTLDTYLSLIDDPKLHPENTNDGKDHRLCKEYTATDQEQRNYKEYENGAYIQFNTKSKDIKTIEEFNNLIREYPTEYLSEESLIQLLINIGKNNELTDDNYTTITDTYEGPSEELNTSNFLFKLLDYSIKELSLNMLKFVLNKMNITDISRIIFDRMTVTDISSFIRQYGVESLNIYISNRLLKISILSNNIDTIERTINFILEHTEENAEKNKIEKWKIPGIRSSIYVKLMLLSLDYASLEIVKFCIEKYSIEKDARYNEIKQKLMTEENLINCIKNNKYLETCKDIYDNLEKSEEYKKNILESINFGYDIKWPTVMSNILNLKLNIPYDVFQRILTFNYSDDDLINIINEHDFLNPSESLKQICINNKSYKIIETFLNKYNFFSYTQDTRNCILAKSIMDAIENKNTDLLNFIKRLNIEEISITAIDYSYKPTYDIKEIINLIEQNNFKIKGFNTTDRLTNFISGSRVNRFQVTYGKVDYNVIKLLFSHTDLSYLKGYDIIRVLYIIYNRFNINKDILDENKQYLQIYSLLTSMSDDIIRSHTQVIPDFPVSGFREYIKDCFKHKIKTVYKRKLILLDIEQVYKDKEYDICEYIILSNIMYDNLLYELEKIIHDNPTDEYQETFLNFAKEIYNKLLQRIKEENEYKDKQEQANCIIS